MRVTGTTAFFKIKKSTVGIPAWAYRDGIYQTNDPGVKAKLRRLPNEHVEEVFDVAKKAPVAPPPKPIEERSWAELVQMGQERGVFRNGMKKSALIALLMKKR